MTHDELLKEMKEAVRYIETLDMINQGGWLAGAKALLAVVELHKPDSNGICDLCDGECWGCGEWGCEWPKCECDCHPLYPCTTIQAIEKELLS